MNGQQVTDRALALLGYTDHRGEPDAAVSAALYKRAVALIDQLCTDLTAAEGGTVTPVTSLSQPLPLSEETARAVLPYGVAMLLAASRGDGDNQQLFAALYTARRRTVRRGERKGDVLPRGCDE